MVYIIVKMTKGSQPQDAYKTQYKDNLGELHACSPLSLIIVINTVILESRSIESTIALKIKADIIQNIMHACLQLQLSELSNI